MKNTLIKVWGWDSGNYIILFRAQSEIFLVNIRYKFIITKIFFTLLNNGERIQRTLK